MKKLSTLIILMTLCVSLVLIGFEATPADASNGIGPIGPSSNFIESELD
jgi:hypothetical protein